MSETNSPRKIKLWPLILAGLTAANGAYFCRNFIGWVITLGFFLIIPGYLLLRTFTQDIKGRWEVMSFSLGLSILLIMLGGLALNSLYVFGMHQPLNTLAIFISFDFITLGLLIFNRRTRTTFSWSPQSWKLKKGNITMFIALTLLPFVAIGGAIRLNNGASDTLTMILFAIITVLFVVLVWRKDLESLYPYATVTMGMAVLLSLSLRGWHITGHDIQIESYVFQLASNAGHWDIASYRNPYNACLSITILPTVLAKITSISAPYVYKAVFQLIFAFGLVPLYLFIKRISKARTALIGAFIFISFPTFINDMPFLNRQEIAFVFFGMLMLANFSPMKRRPKVLLSISFLLGLILSHYSSSYITLALLILTWVFYKILKGKWRVESEARLALPLLSLPVITVALLCTFLWNSQITTTTSGLASTLSQTVHGLFDHSAVYGPDVSYSLLSQHAKSPQQILTKYANSSSTPNLITYLPPQELPISSVGRLVSHVYSAPQLNNLLRSFCAKIFQVLVFIGILVLLVRRRRATAQQLYFLALAIACVVLLTMQILLPQVSIDYGTIRFFQQVLIILGLPIVLATEFLSRFLGKLQLYAMVLFFGFLFLDLSGFVPQLLGGYQPQLALDNSGQIYNVYYVHEGELLAANWIVQQKPIQPVAMDIFAAKARFFPAVIEGRVTLSSPLYWRTHAYFYQDYANLTTQRYATYLSSNTIEYTYNQNFNDENMVYVNSQSRAYTKAQ